MTEKLTCERLKEILSYDPASGIFAWRISPRIGRSIGDQAGRTLTTGYVEIKYKSAHYLAHRLAWLYVTSAWPAGQIDHINGDRADNRWSNLRDVSMEINQQNRRTASPTNSTGLIGVRVRGDRFLAKINVGKRGIHLGTFATAEEAHQAYLKAKRELHEGCTI